MELFWTIFWILLLIVPAIWLATMVWTALVYGVIFIVGLIATGIAWVIDKVRGN